MANNQTSPKHTNLAYLKEISNGSNDFIIQMLTIFVEQMPQSLMRIEEALENKDWKTMRMVVHKIKPSILFTGLTEISNDVPLLEQYAAEESHLDEIPGMVSNIKKVCTEAIEELKEELQKLQ